MLTFLNKISSNDSVNIMKKSSQTFSYASKFFNKQNFQEIVDLYAFVRFADDFVDQENQDAAGLLNYYNKYTKALDSDSLSGDQIIDNFIALARKKNFEKIWTQSFFWSMFSDLKPELKSKYSPFYNQKHPFFNNLEISQIQPKYDGYRFFYETKESLDTYIFGAAEVIGLFIFKILDLSEKAMDGARYLGYAYQYINFIRDLSEDWEIDRVYLNISKYNLENLEKTAIKNSNYKNFIFENLDIFLKKDKQARQYFKYIPYRPKIAIATASDMYIWTARQIYNNPEIVFEKKVKPSKYLVVFWGLVNSIRFLLPGF